MSNVGQDTTNSYVSVTRRVTSKLHEYFRKGQLETATTWNSHHHSTFTETGIFFLDMYNSGLKQLKMLLEPLHVSVLFLEHKPREKLKQKFHITRYTMHIFGVRCYHSIMKISGDLGKEVVVLVIFFFFNQTNFNIHIFIRTPQTLPFSKEM